MGTGEPIAACVFDAYGTLFDVHSAVARLRSRFPDGVADRASHVWRTKQLEYTWLRSLMDRHADFWQVTEDALAYALSAVGIDDQELGAQLMNAYRELDAYPDVVGALERVRGGGLRTAILSNGSPAMLEAAVVHADLSKLIDAVYSVEQVGVFKPHPRVYRLAVERLGLDARSIMFLTANAWDAAGAASFGLRVVWVNRFGQPKERLPAPPDAEMASLAELPDLLGL